ncbi:MAG: hypothetical protein ACTS73_02840 [Arsenophonus sp. NEOnobi-MAG3]
MNRHLLEWHLYSIVYNTYLPQRTIETAIGDVEIKGLKLEIGAATEYNSTARCYRLI